MFCRRVVRTLDGPGITRTLISRPSKVGRPPASAPFKAYYRASHFSGQQEVLVRGACKSRPRDKLILIQLSGILGKLASRALKANQNITYLVNNSRVILSDRHERAALITGWAPLMLPTLSEWNESCRIGGARVKQNLLAPASQRYGPRRRLSTSSDIEND